VFFLELGCYLDNQLPFSYIEINRMLSSVGAHTDRDRRKNNSEGDARWKRSQM